MGKVSSTVNTFAASLSSLEEHIERLERGDLSLEDSIKQFEASVTLYNECRTYLERAEKKITELAATLKEEPLEK